MYDIGDEDLAKAYDPKKVAEKSRNPKFPSVEGQFKHNLLRVEKKRAPKKGNLYEFRFENVEGNNELVLKGAQYTLAYFPGASDVNYEQFWRNVTPILMAVKDETNVAAFNAAEALGELLSLCKDGGPELALGLPFRHNATLEPCKADKDGVIKHKNPDGSPKIFRRDEFHPAA